MRMLIVGYCFGIRSERQLCARSSSIWHIAGFAVLASTATSISVLDDAAFGAAGPREPTSISPTDPSARYTAASDTPASTPVPTPIFVDQKNAVFMDLRRRRRPPGRSRSR